MIGSESISLISEVNTNIESASAAVLKTSQTEECKCVNLDDEEKWKNFFISQNNPSTNTTNKVSTKPHIHKNSDGMYRYTAEENKYNGKEIIGKVVEQIKEEISKNIKNNTAKSIKVKESKNEDNSVKPVIRVVLSDNAKEINMTDLLNGDVCKRYNVRTITFCLPDKSNTRGIRLRIDENGVKIYEVANGSYQMTLKWYVEGKECNIKINIHDNGRVELVEGKGVTPEQLAANNVRVGRQYEAKPLHEALGSQLQKNSETLKVSQPPLTNLIGVATQEHKVCAACHK
ncbi:hypothetical protein [Wolbachia endosymbiont of Folsomia candida]|uniref:hypothetical protein n=1 Tax=Wolbachia endosymbiont of Folsomia candida TaxID=169402 RepID=UPI000AD55912|nr:hypothetical protein [Wolbachia endosymbiont of Folsomia candida]APR98198.1 hypothetical protein ASM33_02710 [Wolbachia endosymbiont of Folsomia candida]